MASSRAPTARPSSSKARTPTATSSCATSTRPHHQPQGRRQLVAGAARRYHGDLPDRPQGQGQGRRRHRRQDRICRRSRQRLRQLPHYAVGQRSAGEVRSCQIPGVIPAQAGIQFCNKRCAGLKLDSRLRGNDGCDFVGHRAHIAYFCGSLVRHKESTMTRTATLTLVGGPYPADRNRRPAAADRSDLRPARRLPFRDHHLAQDHRPGGCVGRPAADRCRAAQPRPACRQSRSGRARLSAQRRSDPDHPRRRRPPGRQRQGPCLLANGGDRRRPGRAAAGHGDPGAARPGRHRADRRRRRRFLPSARPGRAMPSM